jgi:hypothetical protein
MSTLRSQDGLMAGMVVLVLTAHAVLAAPPLSTHIGTLPENRSGMGAAKFGNNAYVVGGGWGETKFQDMLRADVSTGLVERLPVEFGNLRPITAAAAAGDFIYVFGGGGWRFDPANHQVERLGASMPTERSAFPNPLFDGAFLYLIGGLGNGTPGADWGYSNEILRFDPYLDRVEPLKTPLPRPRTHVQAVWDGQHIIVVDGCCYNFDVVTIDPYEDRLVKRDPFPLNRAGAAAFLDQGKIFIVGGNWDFDEWMRSEKSKLILAYHLNNGTITREGELPYALWIAGAVYHPPHLDLFGGGGNSWQEHHGDWILRVTFDRGGRPVARIAHPVGTECSESGAAVQVSGEPSYDPYHQGIAAYEWTWNNHTKTGPLQQDWFPVGLTRVALTVNNKLGEDTAYSMVRVVDSLRPSLEVTRPNNSTLLGHDLGRVMGEAVVQASAADACALSHVTFRGNFTPAVGPGERLDWEVEDPTPPFEFRFEPPLGSRGRVELEVTAHGTWGPPSYPATLQWSQAGVEIPEPLQAAPPVPGS